MSLLPIILAHLRHEREPIDRWLLAAELARLDRLRKLFDAKGERPTSQHEFDDAIGLAITYGHVTETLNGKVRLTVETKVESTQGELF